LQKIVRLELQRQPLAPELQSLWETLLDHACGLAETALRLRDEDGRAYMRFAKARASGKAAQDVIAALEQAVESPLNIMEAAHDGLSCASQAGQHCRKHLLSDLLVVCELLGAASRGAYRIAQANLLLMADSSRKGEYQKMLGRLRHRWSDSFQQVERSILARAGAAGQEA
jgi:formiminotetrahydrofolate cyclodeaminase